MSLHDFLSKPFDKEKFKQILTQIFPSVNFLTHEHTESLENCGHLKGFTQLCEPLNLGAFKLGIGVFETTSIRAKISIHSEILRLLKSGDLSGILCVFYENPKKSPAIAPADLGGGLFKNAQNSVNSNENSSQIPQEFRLSLITTGFDYERNKTTYSNLKRHSFILGHDKIATAQKALQKLIDKAQNAKIQAAQNAKSAQIQGITLADLQEAFAQEPLNREFYTKIKAIFDEILATANIPLDEQGRKEFAIKLLGRVLFVRFLKELSLVPREIFIARENYYATTLAPLFFEVLNTPINERGKDIATNKHFAQIPYLNGGLFSPTEIDCYKETKLRVPDEIFAHLFALLDEYHFTIDEQSPSDNEVALDPELLGQIFENLLAEIDPNLDDSTNVRKATGSFYTPRNIVSFMCQNTILQALKAKFNSNSNLSEKLVTLFEFAAQNSAQESKDSQNSAPTCHSEPAKAGEESTAQNQSINLKMDSSHSANAQNDETSANLTQTEKSQILSALNSLKILDLFCGSGAFPLGILHELITLQELLGDPRSLYERKLAIISNQIYGTDIQPIAVEISRLRCFLSLVIESRPDCAQPNFAIPPLPNLDFKFVCANSFIKLSIDKNKLDQKFPALIDELKDLSKRYFKATAPNLKADLKREFYAKRDSITDNEWVSSDTARMISALDPFNELCVSPFFDSELLLGEAHFDILIGNPPYISTKGKAHQRNKPALEVQDGFFDDAYNHAFFRCAENLAPHGTLSLITPKTFWTIGTKKALRQLIFAHKIDFICDSANPFYSAMVDTCITQSSKGAPSGEFAFIDVTQSFDKPDIFKAAQQIYASADVIFKPTPYNLTIYEKFNAPVKELMSKWWAKIETSAKISKNAAAIHNHRASLKPGDLTLLGLITDGGQGLATANNGKYVGVLSSTKEAARTAKARAEKLYKAKAVWADLGVNFATPKDAQDFLNAQGETRTRELFDAAKLKHGRDIFGQGFIYRIIAADEVATALTPEQKANGIEGAKCFVPYDKGDKDGNRWFLPTPYYIEWSVENVRFLKENSGKKGESMPVVRNPQFYFREGFCWSVVSSEFLKCRLKNNGVFDVQSMSLFSQGDLINDKFLVCLINSALVGKYVKAFINGTVAFQINDARQIPIIIPSPEQLRTFEALFDEAYATQRAKFERGCDSTEILKSVQSRLDTAVYELYGLTSTP